MFYQAGTLARRIDFCGIKRIATPKSTYGQRRTLNQMMYWIMTIPQREKKLSQIVTVKAMSLGPQIHPNR
jgi:hypothetical protein